LDKVKNQVQLVYGAYIEHSTKFNAMIWGVPGMFSCLVVKGLLEIKFEKESTLVLQ